MGTDPKISRKIMKNRMEKLTLNLGIYCPWAIDNFFILWAPMVGFYNGYTVIIQ
jgi:hypothetical protein